MQYMRDTYNFTPSKRAYQTQFKRWNFPSKQNPAHRNADLVVRVKQLWEQNYNQRDMLNILNQEGYGIKERELMRLRAKNRWLLRIPNGMKQVQYQETELPPFTEHSTEGTELTGEIAAQIAQSATAASEEPSLVEVLRKRKERHDQLQTESDERWATKKRRRRTKSYAGLAADPPGPPRFPSETTLEESKEFLSLDAEKYRKMREQFQSICVEEGVIKKTLAGQEKWQSVKDRLLRENSSLRAAFNDEKVAQPSKELALDVICTDVTKRMRTIEQRMTIVDAKNVLGIDPEQSRQIRHRFYTILQADHFTSKLEMGSEHWQQLKNQWMVENPFIQELITNEADDSRKRLKEKALEMLCRDVMKRLRDDQAKSRLRDQAESGTHNNFQEGMTRTVDTESGHVLQVSFNPAQASSYGFVSSDSTDLQIDPSLLQAAENPTDQSSQPVAVYIKPHPASQVHSTTKMWLASLKTKTVRELRQVMRGKWSDAEISQIFGLEKHASEELTYLIEEDEELEAYLEHVSGRKATFLAVLKSI